MEGLPVAVFLKFWSWEGGPWSWEGGSWSWEGGLWS